MTLVPLRLTEELKAIAAEQAARAGISLNQYIATVLAAHIGAQAEAERMFAARRRHRSYESQEACAMRQDYAAENKPLF
jgi:hypothetical protein